MTPALPLLGHATCPHCWTRFAPEDVLWVAAHGDLRGDMRLGDDQPMRFLPTRFGPEGNALDVRGSVCTGLACPHCHLSVPRPLLEIEPFFVSILGTPSCGKSFYLAALSWELRDRVAAQFGLQFTDADPAANLILHDYERNLFLRDRPDEPVSVAELIRKTEQAGELYEPVAFGSQTVYFPRPFQFVIRPGDRHPNVAAAGRIARCVCLYDNAGEHYLPTPGETAPVATKHLAAAGALLFLFDPTQDARFRRRYKPADAGPTVIGRQELTLQEAAGRLRRQLGMADSARVDTPLYVVATKSDAWGHLLGSADAPEPWSAGRVAGFDILAVEARSRATRELLSSTCADVVVAAESLSTRVTYVPVSALGTTPARGASAAWTIRPSAIRPRWVTVPLLAALQVGVKGLIGRTKSSSQYPTARRAMP